MDCPLSDGDLVAYHLGTVDDPARDAIEAHFVACATCLRAYLATKRAIERPVRPRDEVRRRLRAEVELAFKPTAAARVRRVLSRPIPLYQGLAAAAGIALVLGLGPALVRSRSAPSATAYADRVDSARPGAFVNSRY
jgi:anti-sigma factor RsiW